MSTLAPAALPARPPSLKAAWYWENRKSGNRWYWPIVLVICTLGLATGYYHYVTNVEIFQAQGATWIILWCQSLQMPSLLFLPLAAGALVAQSSAAEHEGRNWQRMSANQLATTLIAGKLLHNLQVAALTCAIFYLETAAVGLYLGFDPAGILSYLPRLAVMVLGTWAMLTFITWLGVVITSFAGVMTAVTIGAVGSFGLLLTKPLMALNPLALITWCGAQVSPEAVTSPGHIAFSAIIALIWAAVLSLAIGRAVRKRA